MTNKQKLLLWKTPNAKLIIRTDLKSGIIASFQEDGTAICEDCGERYHYLNGSVFWNSKVITECIYCLAKKERIRDERRSQMEAGGV